MAPRLDHVVVDVQHRIDEAARRYLALGFQLTERGRHTLGSENHLAMFGSDYLELLGTGEPSSAVRADLSGFPIGLNGLVFKLDGAERVYADLRERGIPVQPVQSFSRPVRIGGTVQDARFKTVRLEPRTIFDGRVYFCEHLTPDLVWRPEWEDHPNGALAITRVVIATEAPDRVAAAFSRMFGPGAAGDSTDGGRILRAGEVSVDIVPHAQLGRQFKDFLPTPDGRSDYMAALGIRVRSLARLSELLREARVLGVQAAPGCIRVHPAEAMNVLLEFSE